MPSRPTRTRIPTEAGKAYAEVLQLKADRAQARAERRKLALQANATADGGASPRTSGDNTVVLANLAVDDISWECPYDGGVNDCTLDVFLAFLAPTSFPDSPGMLSLVDWEVQLDWHSCLDLQPSIAFLASSRPTLDISKPPNSYPEALARPDTAVWRAAMEREMTSLTEMGAFVETDLPKGQKAVGLRWTYVYKTDAEGKSIPGKEKARLVAQGFTQIPGVDFNDVFSPVVKHSSIRMLLSLVAMHDYELEQ